MDLDDLSCSNEEDVLHAVLMWINYDVAKRKIYAFEVLSTVRFRSITIRELDNAMRLIAPISDRAFLVVMASIRKDLQFNRLFR